MSMNTQKHNIQLNHLQKERNELKEKLDLDENKKLAVADVKKANADILREEKTNRDKYSTYAKQLSELITARKEQKILETVLMNQTLQPGGKVNWYNPHNPVPPTELSNPFIEKSDIVNHKQK